MSTHVPFETTLEVRDTCLSLHTQRAARVLARRFDDAFRPLGITSRQFSLMMSLNRPEPPSLGAVARVLAMDRTTLTAALKPLERARLIVVRPDPKDRRARRLSLTRRGAAVLAQAVPVWRELHGAIEAELDTAHPDALRAALRALGAAGDERRARRPADRAST